jgi:hypothetical protein
MRIYVALRRTTRALGRDRPIHTLALAWKPSHAICDARSGIRSSASASLAKDKQVAVGLDEKAVEAVKQYKFQAGQFQGKPVPGGNRGQGQFSNLLTPRNRIRPRREQPVRRSVLGPNMICFDCFLCSSLDLLVDIAKSYVGLRPSFSAQVRFGEPGAPVQSGPVPIEAGLP